MKLLVSHFQLTAMCEFSSDNLPNSLKSFFRAQGSASSMSPNLSFVSCELTPTIIEKIYFIVALPVALVILFCFIQGLRVLLREIKVLEKTDSK